MVTSAWLSGQQENADSPAKATIVSDNEGADKQEPL